MFGGIPLEVIMALVSAVGSFIMKNIAMKRENDKELMLRAMERDKDANFFANEAEKRSPWLRKFAGIMIISVAVLGLLIVAFFPDIDTTLVVEKAQKSFMGFEWGKSYDIIKSSGFVVPQYLSYSIHVIIGMLFGSGFAKTK